MASQQSERSKLASIIYIYIYIGGIVSIDPFIKTRRAIIKEEIMSVRTIIIIDDNNIIAGYV